jgi:hypothetical protein
MSRQGHDTHHQYAIIQCLQGLMKSYSMGRICRGRMGRICRGRIGSGANSQSFITVNQQFSLQ